MDNGARIGWRSHESRGRCSARWADPLILDREEKLHLSSNPRQAAEALGVSLTHFKRQIATYRRTWGAADIQTTMIYVHHQPKAAAADAPSALVAKATGA